MTRLVAFDSTSARGNRAIADDVASLLDGAGITVERFATEDGERVTLLGRLGPEPDESGAGLVLCGHLDCVPATEPEWTSDPFTLTERGDTLVARGSCDMKGFDAIAIGAMLDRAASPPDAPLWILLTDDEEVGSLGAKRLVETWPAGRPWPKSVLIGEPTSMRAIRLHKGHLKLRVTTRGRAAHSGSPHLGANAIAPMIPIAAALESLRAELVEERVESSPSFSKVPFVALNIARIDGGVAANVIPETCTLDVGVRPLPGQDVGALQERLEATIRGAAVGDVEIVTTGDNPPLATSAEAPLVQALDGTDDGASFSSDGGWLARGFDLDCVLCGPGSIEVAHRPNEFVPIAELEASESMVGSLIDRFCGGGAS